MSNPQDPHSKKGLSGVAIAGIGCGALLLLAIVGGILLVTKVSTKVKEFAGDPAAAAVWALELNPDIDVVKKDDTRREITYRTKSTGETTVISYEDLKKGKLTLKNDKGQEYGFDASKAETDGVVIKTPDGQKITAGKAATSLPPAEVPVYPGLAFQDGGYRVEQADTVSGVAMGQVTDSLAKVKEHYEAALKAAGFEVTAQVSGDNGPATLTAKKADGKSSITVTIQPEASAPEKVQITTQYQLAKP